MRRKLFTIFIFVIIFLFILDFLNVDLKPSSKRLLSLESKTNSYVLYVSNVKPKNDYISLVCQINSINNKEVKFRDKVLINLYNENYKAYDLIFSFVEYKGSFELPSVNRNPHVFNYRNYLKSSDVFLIASTKDIKIKGYDDNLLKRAVRFLFLKKDQFISYLSNDSKGLITGILFGDTSYLSDEIYDDFRRNGTSHILAVSGLHIGMIYSLLEKLKKNKGILFDLFILTSLIVYGYLTMWSISSKRAIFMIAQKMISKRFDLRYDSLTSLGTVGLILIICNPYVIYSTAFQISFLSVLSICVIGSIIKTRYQGIKTSVAVTIGISGYQAYVFNYVTPFSVIANVPIIYITTYLMPISFIFFIAFMFLGESFTPFFILNGLSNLLIEINSITSFDNRLSFDCTNRIAYILIIVSVFFFFKSSEYFFILKNRGNKVGIKRLKFTILIVLIVFYAFTYSPLDNADILFIDVGQGDAILIRDGRKNVLIDGGGKYSYNVGENILKPVLLKNGVNHIDLSLLTHLHMDHYKGVSELNEVYKIRNMVKSSVYGDCFKVTKDLFIKTVWPNSWDNTDEKNSNENCSIYLVNYKGVKILITGDLSGKDELKLVKEYGNEIANCDILKVSHHGSNSSSSEEFLSLVSPKYAVIQVGKNNYGHPSEETLYKLKNINAIILRNDTKGAIGFEIDNKKIEYHTVLN